VTYKTVSYAQASFACDTCKRLSVGWIDVSYGGPGAASGDEERWATADVTWHPKWLGQTTYEHVPDHINSAADEAWKCHGINAHRAAVLLARSVIEATAKDKGITSGVLASKIEQMREKDLVRPHIEQAAHEIRHIGNDMAHGDYVDPISAEESDEVLTLMGEVLDEVYSSPGRVAARKAARQEKVPPVSA